MRLGQSASLRLWGALAIAIALAARSPHAAAQEARPDRSQDRPAKRISLDVKDASIHNVLRLLADTGRVNIVVPDDVQGRLTLRLKNVPWNEALRVVLRMKGLGMERIGEVIQIDTEERILKRAAAQAEIAAWRTSASPLVTRLVPVAYARAAELKPIVQSMLTARGRIEVDVRTNTLIITDVAESDAFRARLPTGVRPAPGGE